MNEMKIRTGENAALRIELNRLEGKLKELKDADIGAEVAFCTRRTESIELTSQITLVETRLEKTLVRIVSLYETLERCDPDAYRRTYLDRDGSGPLQFPPGSTLYVPRS
jgi:hypothetical protein